MADDPFARIDRRLRRLKVLVGINLVLTLVVFLAACRVLGDLNG
jgi:hypothetical protein